MKNNAKYRKYYIGTTVVICVIITVVLGYKLGYRVTNNFTIGKVGTLSMTIPLVNTRIYIDESEKIQTTKDNEVVNLTLSPTKHSVLIGRDGYFPWMQKFIMPSGGTVTLTPMFVTQNASGEIITMRDPEYWKIKNLVTANTLPTKDTPRTLTATTTGTTSIWVEDNTIMVKNGDLIRTIVQPDEDITDLEFYKNRTDAVIFSAGNGVYVIEIDGKEIKNFLPIYKGKTPLFTETDPNYIYVLDGENLMAVVI